MGDVERCEWHAGYPQGAPLQGLEEGKNRKMHLCLGVGACLQIGTGGRM